MDWGIWLPSIAAAGAVLALLQWRSRSLHARLRQVDVVDVRASRRTQPLIVVCELAAQLSSDVDVGGG